MFQCSIKCMQYITSHLHNLESSETKKFLLYSSIIIVLYLLDLIRCILACADSKLIARLACLRCAKMECKDFDATAIDSFAGLFATAMHHADEQVG